jgi:hypothetical protein
MATTTNYGWTTPNDTDLVKDGASAIRTLGTAIDTTTKNLNPSTTLGDIEYRSSTANTNTRLGIGSTGQVLTVSSGVPAWETISGGGTTLISTTAMPTGASSVEITSIPTTYNELIFRFVNCYQAGHGAQSNPNYFILNGDTGSNYNHACTYNYNVGGVGQNWTTVSNNAFTDARCFMMNGDSSQSFYEIIIYKANESVKHFYEARGGNYNTAISYATGVHTATSAAISSFKFWSTNGNFGGGNILLYGVKY